VTSEPDPDDAGDVGAHEDEALDELITRADLDSLVRLVDDRCESRDWAGLLRLRDRARVAVRTGRQLWPAATLADYRLALLAPPEWAARVLTDDAGRFALGPLPEVAAQHHRWDELAPHLTPGPISSLVAHERVLRGEVLADDLRATAFSALDVPLELQPWEPEYALATYRPNSIEAPAPELRPGLAPLPAASSGVEVEDPDVELAVRQLVEPWTAASNGTARVVAVEGDVVGAVRAIVDGGDARLAPLTAADALAWAAWAGASGGAHGRRRGAAVGRFGAWWLVAALAGVVDEWPIAPGEVGALAAELQWFAWDRAAPGIGWELRLAVADPGEGLAWAIEATDRVEESGAQRPRTVRR
jgi:hypothetical protein